MSESNPCWPFLTAEESAQYHELQAAGYALLKQAHEMFLPAAYARMDEKKK